MRELDVTASAFNVALMQPLYAREVHHEGFANRIWKNRYPILIRGTRFQLLRRARTVQELTLNAGNARLIAPLPFAPSPRHRDDCNESRSE